MSPDILWIPAQGILEGGTAIAANLRNNFWSDNNQLLSCSLWDNSSFSSLLSIVFVRSSIRYVLPLSILFI
jgi:hypothetical protein